MKNTTFLVVVPDELVGETEPMLNLIARSGVTVVRVGQQEGGEALEPTTTSKSGTYVRTLAEVREGVAAAVETGGNGHQRPLSGHTRHLWHHEAADTDRCLKCGMTRLQGIKDKPKGTFVFEDRTGRQYGRPPFEGKTPNCDEALVRRRSVVGG